MTFGAFGAVIGGDGVDYAESDVVARESDWELVCENVLLGFEIGGLKSENLR